MSGVLLAQTSYAVWRLRSSSPVMRSAVPSPAQFQNSTQVPLSDKQDAPVT